MKNEDLFKYQEEAMTLLTKAYKKQKFAHAYLLDGENGTGITDAAIYMAKQLICKKDNAPCMECDDCKQIDAKTHLNYIYIEPENDTIRKEQIEKLIHDFSMTSLDGTPQVYIIQSADKMNTSASNALLKFLEEPIPNRYAFLTTNNHSRMLDTIVSRCQMIHFKPIPKEYLVEQLKSFGVESDIAYVISYLTTETDVAMKYIEDGKVLNYLTVAKKIIDKDLKNKDPYIEYYRNRKMFIEEKDKTYHRFFLDVLVLIYQELLKKANNMNEKYFVDILNILQPEEIDKEQIINKLELINLYQERFNYYVNIDLQYASLFSKL